MHRRLQEVRGLRREALQRHQVGQPVATEKDFRMLTASRLPTTGDLRVSRRMTRSLCVSSPAMTVWMRNEPSQVGTRQQLSIARLVLLLEPWPAANLGLM